MKKKVTFEGFQCDACGKLLPSNFIPYTFKVKMSGPDGCIKKDKMCLCFGCAQSMTNMIDGWYERNYFEREKNKEKCRAMLAIEEEKECPNTEKSR